MTASTLAPAEPTERHATTLHFVRMDEPIIAAAGSYASLSELPSLLFQMGREATGPLTLILCLNGGTKASELSALLGCKHAGHRLVVTGGSEEALEHIGASFLAHGWRHVAYEPSVRQAVVGAMQHLRAGDAFLLLGPAQFGRELLTQLVEHGARWRGSLQPFDEACC